MKITIKPWPRADLITTIVAVACLALVEIVFLANWIAPSAVVAGCKASPSWALSSSNRLFVAPGAPLRNRAKAFGLLLVIIVAGSIGMLVFGR